MKFQVHSPERIALVPVLATLLHFSRAELAELKQVATSDAAAAALRATPGMQPSRYASPPAGSKRAVGSGSGVGRHVTAQSASQSPLRSLWSLFGGGGGSARQRSREPAPMASINHLSTTAVQPRASQPDFAKGAAHQASGSSRTGGYGSVDATPQAGQRSSSPFRLDVEEEGGDPSSAATTSKDESMPNTPRSTIFQDVALDDSPQPRG